MFKSILKDYRAVGLIWIALVIACVVQVAVIKGTFNNYLIFKGVFFHTTEKLNLYLQYPKEYFDNNHYGVFFSLIIAPFAILPDRIGCVAWIVANAGLLFWAIRQLPMKKNEIIIVLLISAHDMYTAIRMQQFNPSVSSMLILSYVFVRKGKDHWATLMIVVGMLTKLYGVVGLAFFFFSKNKLRFIVSGIAWLVICFCIPAIYSSFDFVVEQYKNWFEVLSTKNVKNLDTQGVNLQNLSLLGFLQRTGLYANNAVVIAIALVLFSLPYLRVSQWKNTNFQLGFLSLASMFLVLCSTGTENSTYVIGYVGVGIWFVITPKKYKWLKISLLSLAILGSLSPTDLVPKKIKWDYVIRYSIRAVPVALIYVSLVYQMCFWDFRETNEK